MGKSWEEVTADPGFAILNPTQQYNTQLDYFDAVVMPKMQDQANTEKRILSNDEMRGTFKDFFQKYPPPEGSSPEYFPPHLKKTMRMEKKKISDQDVDFDSPVTNLPFQINYERAKSNEERMAVFKKYGMTKDDVRPLARGGHALNPSGMEKIGVQHHGVPTSIKPAQNTVFDPNFMGQFTVEAPKIATEVAAGMRGNARGLIGGGLLTGLTGGAVEGADEYIKHLQGLQKREPSEITKDVMTRGATAALGDSAIRGLQPAARKLVMGPQVSRGRIRDSLGFGKMKQHESMIDPEDPTLGRAMQPDAIQRTEAALDSGMRPMISRAGESARFPVTKMAGGGQEVLNRLLGDPNTFYNTGRAQVLADALIQKSKGGITQEVGESTFGKKMSQTALKSGATKQKSIARLLLDADKLVERNIKNLKKSSPLGDWNYENLSSSISKNKQDFSVAMSEKIKFLDQKNANVKNIPSQPIKDMIQEWVDKFPDKVSKTFDDETGNAFAKDVVEGKSWMSPDMKHYFGEAMQMEDTISFTQLHNLRTMFSGAAWDDGLLKTVDKHRAGQMKNLLDGLAEGTPTLSRKLKAFNKQYKEGMDKYDDNMILSLAKQGKDRLPLNKITDRLIDMDVKTADKLRSVLPKDDWNKMGYKLFEDITQRSRNSATDNIEPSLMLDQIKKLKNNRTFGKIFPSKRGQDIVKALKELESRGYEGDLSKLLQRDTDVSKVLQSAIEEQKVLDDYMGENFMRVLTGKEPAKAMKWALSNNAQAKQMMEYIADKPELQNQARMLVMKRGLGGITSTQKGYASPVLDGESLSKFIHKYASMPENPAKTILGKELWGELDTLSQTLKLTEFKAGGAIGAAAQGMQFLQKPIQMLPKALRFGVMGRVLSNPSFVRYMSTGLKKGVGGGFGVQSREHLGAFFRTVAQIFTDSSNAEGYTPPAETFELKDSQVYQELMQ